MPAPRPLVTAMVASAGALVLSCLSAFALTTADAETAARSASARTALPFVALSSPATLDAAIGSEPAPIAEPPSDERAAPRSERRIPPATGRVPQPAPAPAPAPSTPDTPAPGPTPEPTPSPTGEPSPSPEPSTTPTPTPPAETPEEPTSGNGASSTVTAPVLGFLVPRDVPDAHSQD